MTEKAKTTETAISVQTPSKMAEDAIAEHAKTGGSTFDPRTGQNLSGTHNIAVGLAPEHSSIHDRPLTAQDHDDFIAANHHILAKHGNSAVGTYHENGLHHIEVVGLTPSRQAAVAAGQHLGEDHVFNLATDDKTPTGHAGPRQPSHLNVDERFEQLRAGSPKREPYTGTHFSDEKLDKIEGARRGELGAKKLPPTNADHKRVRLGTKTGLGPDAPAGFYTAKAGTVAPPMMAMKKHPHQIRGQFAFGSTDHPAFQQAYAAAHQQASTAGAKPDVAHGLGLNAGEHALQAAGFDGYNSPNHPGVNFHFGDHVVEPESKREQPVKS
jgi:hypothetical protein